MNFIVKDKIDEVEHKSILDFLSSISFFCIEQHPDWHYEEGKNLIYYFICTGDNQKIHCYSKIVISINGPFKVANIEFGPAFEEYDILAESIGFLHNYFIIKGFIYFSIQLGINISEKSELLEYKINKNFKVKYYFKPENLWSSLAVDLRASEDEIYANFSKGHKCNIKTSYKNGLSIIFKKDNCYFDAFVDLYIKMLESRKLEYDKNTLITELTYIFKFINTYNKGFIGYILDKDALVGTLIVIFQGNSARYLKSACDPERRNFPIMHLGLFEAMKYCKANGFSTFDLWGYNHFVDEKDQIFKINIFKKGFTDNFTFFPKRFNFELKPNVYKVFRFLKFFKNGIDNLIMKRMALMVIHS